MSRSNRLSYFAGLLALLFALSEPSFAHAAKPYIERFSEPEQTVEHIGVVQQNADSKSGSSNHSQNYDQQTPKGQRFARRIGAGQFGSPNYALTGYRDCDDECQRDQDDLKAQESMARSTFWMMVVSLGALIATIVGVILVYLNLREARKVTSEAEQTARAAVRQADLQEVSFKNLERPYVLPGAISRIRKSPDRIVRLDGVKYICCDIGNYGRTPAIIHYILESFGPTPDKHHSDPDSGIRKLPRDFAKGVVLAASELAENPFIAEFPGVIEIVGKPGRFAPKYKGADEVYFVINIKFEDVSGKIRISRFTWKWEGMHSSFLRYGGKKYNYEIEVDDQAESQQPNNSFHNCLPAALVRLLPNAGNLSGAHSRVAASPAF